MLRRHSWRAKKLAYKTPGRRNNVVVMGAGRWTRRGWMDVVAVGTSTEDMTEVNAFDERPVDTQLP